LNSTAWVAYRANGAEFGEYPYPETRYISTDWSSIADGSDCPIIGPDCEFCRCIGQALLEAAMGMK